MAIRCMSKDVSVPEAGKLLVTASWTSNRSGGEFARFEVRLPDEGPFRFLVGGVRSTKIKVTQRKVGTDTEVEISTSYVNLIPGPEKRLARFEICGITKSPSGAETEVISKIAKFLS